MELPKIPFGDAKRALKHMLKKSGAKIKRQGLGSAPVYVTHEKDPAIKAAQDAMGLKGNHVYIGRGEDRLPGGKPIFHSKVVAALHETGHSLDPRISERGTAITHGHQGTGHLSPSEQEHLNIVTEKTANKNALGALKETGAKEGVQKAWKKNANHQMKEGYRKPLISRRWMAGKLQAEKDAGREPWNMRPVKPKYSEIKKVLQESPHLRKKNVDLSRIQNLIEFMDGPPSMPEMQGKSKLKKRLRRKLREFGMISEVAGQMATLPLENSVAKKLKPIIKKGLSKLPEKWKPSEAWSERIGDTASYLPGTVAGAAIGEVLGKKKMDKPKEFSIGSLINDANRPRSDTDRRLKGIGAYGSNAVTGGFTGAVIAGARAAKKGVNIHDPKAIGPHFNRGAAIGAGAGLAYRAIAHKKINKLYKEDKNIKAAALQVPLMTAAGAGALGVGGAIAATAAAGHLYRSPKTIAKAAGKSKIGRKFKAALLNRERHANPTRRTKVVPHGKIIDANTGKPNLEIADKSTHNLLSAKYPALTLFAEEMNEQKKRKNWQTAKDATKVGAGVAGIAGIGLLTHKGSKAISGLAKRGRAGLRVAARKASQTSDSVNKLVNEHGKGIATSAQEALDNIKNATAMTGDMGRIYVKAKENVTGHIPKAAKEGFHEGVQSNRPHLGRRIANGLGFRVRKEELKAKIREIFFNYRDEEYEQPKRILTEKDHAEIAADRKHVRNLVLGGLATAGVGAYAVSGNPLLKSARSHIGSLLKEHAPDIGHSKTARKWFPHWEATQAKAAEKVGSTEVQKQELVKTHKKVGEYLKEEVENPLKAIHKKKPKGPIHEASAKLKLINFGKEDQLVDTHNVYSKPLDVATGKSTGHVRDYDDKGRATGSLSKISREEAIGHHQVIKGVYRKAEQVQKHGGRALNLIRDAADVVRGEPRAKDPWGRKRKREWEKSWFKNAAGATVGTVGALALIKKFPKQSEKVVDKLSHASDLWHGTSRRRPPEGMVATSAILDSVKHFDSTLNELDYTAPDWDLRHQHRKSVRVYAPEAHPRERREKKWHEKIGNERKMWAGGVLAAGAVGAAINHGASKAKFANRLKNAIAKSAERHSADLEKHAHWQEAEIHNTVHDVLHNSRLPSHYKEQFHSELVNSGIHDRSEIGADRENGSRLMPRIRTETQPELDLKNGHKKKE
jgi:hypothetical protein